MDTSSKQRPHFIISMLLGLALFLTACGGNSGNNANNGSQSSLLSSTPQGTSTVASATSTPAPGIGLGAQACPLSVKDPGHWDSIIPTQPGVSKVESVTCGYLKGIASLQALVTIRYSGTGAILDGYVYDNLTAASPNQIFKLQNLYKGDAKISKYNTLLSAEVDSNSHVNLNQPNAALQQDLYREFKWSDAAGTLVQVTFPGIFPDMTRYQAESDQGQVNQGRQPWKLNATMTAQAFGAGLLHWDPNAPATLVSGGGSTDIQAVVSLKNSAPAGGTIKLTMARLEQNANGGIWIITDVAASGMSITSPGSLSEITSPITVTGTGNAFEAVIGSLAILDHTGTDIGHATVKGATGNGNTTFSTSVSFTSTFKSGAEEGLLVLTAENNAGGPASTAVIVKVLL